MVYVRIPQNNQFKYEIKPLIRYFLSTLINKKGVNT
jgi:hypothetical protein